MDVPFRGKAFHEQDLHDSTEPTGTRDENEELTQHCDQLKTFLKAEAEYACQLDSPSYLSTDSQKHHNLLDLELFVKSLSLESDGSWTDYFSNRQNFAERNAPPVGNLSSKKLFSGEKLPLDFDFEDKENVINAVYLLGAPGSGKTTLAKSMLRKYATQNSFAADYLFFLQCHQIDFDTSCNLLQLLATALPHHWIRDRDSCIKVLSKLGHSEKVFIIIDGINDVPNWLSSGKASTYVDALPASFIKGIVNGNIFSKAKVLVTGRPSPINPVSSIPYTVEILGLTIANQSLLCRRICADRSLQILYFIQGHHFLSYFCSNVENCLSVIHVTNACLSPQNEHFSFALPLTRVMIAAFALLLRNRNLRLKTEVLKRFADQAWCSIKEEKYFSINDKDLHADIETEAVSKLITLRCDDTRGEISVSCHFISLEILAAIHCVFFMDLDKYEEFLDHLFNVTRHSPMWSVALHVCGLCDRVTGRYAKKLLSTSVSNQKISLLKARLKNHINTANKLFGSSLLACSLTHSLQDASIAAACASQFGDSIKISGRLCLSNVAGLHYALQTRDKPLFLIVDSEAASSGEVFLSFLLLIIELPIAKISAGYENKFIFEKELSSAPEDLLCFCCTDESVHDIMSMVQRSDKPVAQLVLAGSNITVRQAWKLKRCFSQISKLTLKHCYIPHIAFEIFIDEMKFFFRKWNRPLEIELIGANGTATIVSQQSEHCEDKHSGAFSPNFLSELISSVRFPFDELQGTTRADEISDQPSSSSSASGRHDVQMRTLSEEVDQRKSTVSAYHTSSSSSTSAVSFFETHQDRTFVDSPPTTLTTFATDDGLKMPKRSDTSQAEGVETDNLQKSRLKRRIMKPPSDFKLDVSAGETEKKLKQA